MFTFAAIGLLGCRHQTAAPTDSSSDGRSTFGVHEVRMIGSGDQFIFEPDRIVIEPGETVRFVVESSGHTATAYHPSIRGSSPLRIPEGAEPWDSGILSSAGESFEQMFDIEGVHNYYCLPHEGSGMVGVIVVGRALDGPGTTEPEDTLPIAARNTLKELIEWSKRQ